MPMIDELIALMKEKSDAEVWYMAVLFVGFAGDRAHKLGRDDVNDACVSFVEAMHEYVDTPQPPERFND